MQENVQAREFKTTLTPKAFLLASPVIMSSILVFYFALDAMTRFHESDPSRYVFTGLPIVVSFTLIAAVGLIFHRYTGQKVVLEARRLSYQGRNLELTLDAARMAYSPPGDNGLLKVMMLSDGANFIQLPKPFMQDAKFEELALEIEKVRRVHRLGSSSTYSL